jgi:quinolinate synthase
MEPGVMYRLQHENPGKIFYPAALFALCPNRKKTTLEKFASRSSHLIL